MPNVLAGISPFGARVDSVITYHPKIVTYESVELPTSDPATAQVQLTIESGDLPTCSGSGIPINASANFYEQFKSFLYAYVYNNSGGSATVYAKQKTTTTPMWSGATSKSLTAGQYCSYATGGLNYPKLGDTQEIRLYASAAGVFLVKAALIEAHNYLAAGLSVVPIVNAELFFSGASWLSGTASNTGGEWSPRFFYDADGAVSADILVKAGVTHSFYGLGIIAGGSGWQTATSTDTLRHYQPYYPTRVAYTPILL